MEEAEVMIMMIAAEILAVKIVTISNAMVDTMTITQGAAEGKVGITIVMIIIVVIMVDHRRLLPNPVDMEAPLQVDMAEDLQDMVCLRHPLHLLHLCVSFLVSF